MHGISKFAVAAVLLQVCRAANVNVQRIFTEPTLSVANSKFPYTYNPASFAIDSENYLFARIQKTTKDGPRDVL